MKKILALFIACLVLCAGAIQAAPAAVPSVGSMDEFAAIATQTEGDSYIKFLVDRTENKIHYIDTKTYPFHYDFVKTIMPNLSPEMFNEMTYFTTNRRFIAGTIGYHANLKLFSFQYWEGDNVTEDIVTLNLAKLAGTFFEKKLAFKPNSPVQEELAKKLSVKVITNDDLYANLAFKVYNSGAAVGRLRVLKAGENPEDAYFDKNEIVLLDVIPSDITPVAGIIATKFSTPLSHVNLRAYAWKIPNMVMKTALTEYTSLIGEVVFFKCNPKGYEVRKATKAEIEEYERSHRPPPAIQLEADIRYKEMPAMGVLGKKDAFRIGTKSANISEMVKRGGLNVPPGFAVPFYWWNDFLKHNKLAPKIKSTLTEKRFGEDPAYRRAQLAELKKAIQSAEHSPAFKKAFLARTKTLEGRGLFVRSSTNSEDLPGFNGAGLYDSVPNVRGDDALLDAVKVVWSSIFNWKAYQERAHYGIDHLTVQPAVTVLASVDAKAAGVAITTDIYDANFPESFTINAKKGLGISVVDGKSIPEQVIYDPYYDSIKVISRSEDKVELVIGPDGGVIEKPIEGGKPVLSPDDVRMLAQALQRVREVFTAEGPQDVEWVISGEGALRRAWVVQSRPYLGGGTATAPNAARAMRPMDGAKIEPPAVQPASGPKPRDPARRVRTGPSRRAGR
jgi:hypothetical protein